ncbi:IS110 family transposase [Weissella paramesenteroides]|uniref:IS110 family transposase n=1 Tax=Weissella paramesenteroides TaxID=1249 RepID=A0ABD4XKK8_WEIPA|nr:MobP2 family relaxase [Weissella paramesenteroides]MDF8369687.1 IS110 family transposase [Weissella paramesenteroides]MDF8371745.1 IS110 family transposase [Weissella paramesenteroides]
MAKTGGFANFATGEKKTGAVLLPTHFTTAAQATKAGKQFGNLVRTYAAKSSKVMDENNQALVDITDAEQVQESSNSFGYSSRFSATGDEHPLFDSHTLNMTDEQMDNLEEKLNLAQANGNILHEMAFSMRGDWLVENGLYNPETKQLDQDKLKRAEQHIVHDLFEKGGSQPLGQGPDDVVWFGAVHQDTDHLNMHIWYAKVSPETCPSMLHKNGEPKGIIDFKAKHQAESKFRYELESEATKMQRANVYEAVGNYRGQIKQDSLTKLDQAHKYTPDLQKIYDVLPQDLRGRWKVGNTDTLVTDDKSRMALANRQMNTLIDKLLTHELKDDYQAFKTTAQKMDAIMTATHGQQHQGQAKWSETQDQRLRKELANGIYRQFNEQFKPGSHENDDKFHKQANSNFEKAKQKQQPAEKPQLKQHKAAPLGKLNKIAKRMTKQSRQEMQQVERMLQETMAEQSQDISDESLTRHL